MPVYFVEINLSQGQQANLLTVVSVPGPMFIFRKFFFIFGFALFHVFAEIDHRFDQRQVEFINTVHILNIWRL